jgi:hypothetical protein
MGMEPKGHDWWNLANWLADKGLNVVLVNPATTKRKVQSSLQPFCQVLVTLDSMPMDAAANTLLMNIKNGL